MFGLGKKAKIIIGVFIALFVVGAITGDPETDNSNTSPSPTYEWEKLQSYDSAKVVFFKFSEELDIFELPQNTQEDFE